MKECQYRFRESRWNCSVITQSQGLFAKIIQRGKYNIGKAELIVYDNIKQSLEFVKLVFQHLRHSLIACVSTIYLQIIKQKKAHPTHKSVQRVAISEV